MPQTSSVDASLPPRIRKHLAVKVLSKQEAITQIAEQYDVSRKFLYQQKETAAEALDSSCSGFS